MPLVLKPNSSFLVTLNGVGQLFPVLNRSSTVTIVSYCNNISCIQHAVLCSAAVQETSCLLSTSGVWECLYREASYMDILQVYGCRGALLFNTLCIHTGHSKYPLQEFPWPYGGGLKRRGQGPVKKGFPVTLAPSGAKGALLMPSGLSDMDSVLSWVPPLTLPSCFPHSLWLGKKDFFQHLWLPLWDTFRIFSRQRALALHKTLFPTHLWQWFLTQERIVEQTKR